MNGRILDQIAPADRRTLAESLYPGRRAKNGVLTVGNINGDPATKGGNGSFVVWLENGRFREFGTAAPGTPEAGDLITLLAYHWRMDARETTAELRRLGYLGNGLPGALPVSDRRDRPLPAKTPVAPLLAAPADTPMPDAGRGARYHAYRWADGTIPVVVVRKSLPDGGKRIFRRGWTGNQWVDAGTRNDAPMPLYRLTALLDCLDSPVLLVEGEKTADFAAGLDYVGGAVVVCPLGGSNPAGGTDWAPLRGRRVVVLGDADSQGRKFATDTAAKARAAGAAAVGILTPARAWGDLGGVGPPPPGWDLADAIPGCLCAADAWLHRAAREEHRYARAVAMGRRSQNLGPPCFQYALAAYAECGNPVAHDERMDRARAFYGEV